MARQKRPTVPPQVSNYVVDSYVRLRKISKDEEAENKSHTYTSARTLLGVLRLAQALARLRFSNTVEHADVDEALRLMEVSKESLQEDAEQERETDKSAVSQVYRLIKGMATKRGKEQGRKPKTAKRRKLGRGPGRERDAGTDSDEEGADETEELTLIDIRARVLRAGFTEAQLNETIAEVCPCPNLPHGPLTDYLFRSTRASTWWRVWPMAPSCGLLTVAIDLFLLSVLGSVRIFLFALHFFAVPNICIYRINKYSANSGICGRN